ncbi:signal protein [Nonomuraea sp. NPDC005650]|uniref:signal protein n=1 Tax=Nonomuraea sp. NPDC005650 TaxID=3157045 RepID=UPI0033BCDA56
MSLRSAVPLLLTLNIAAGCGVVQSSDANGIGSSKPRAAVSESIQGRWWTWAASEDESTNPVTDTTGEFCDRNQPKDVWFLAGTFGGTIQRTCNVPAGRPVVLPLVNQVGTEEQCREFMATSTGKATLDGKVITPERLEDDNVAITGVAGNPLTGEEGTVTSYACGVWARLPALKPGRHKLTIRGSSGNFRTGVDYTLIVQPDQQA